MIRVLHCVDSLARKTGGPAHSIVALTDNLSIEGSCKVTLICQNLINEQVVAACSGSMVDRRISFSQSDFSIRTGYPLKRLLIATVQERMPMLIHDNGIWLPSNYHVSVVARKFGIPLVLHTHGMLQPWALNYRSWKKRLALFVYQRRIFKSASVLFATSDQEAFNIRLLGFRQPIAIIPNGVKLGVYRNDITQQNSVLKRPRIVLFLGRIHPIKGLINLIEAWGRVRPKGWCLYLAGPDENGHLSVIMKLVKSLNLEALVKHVGEVGDYEKKVLFERADLLVLPSFSENFGIVVAEALAHGVPVITTYGTPWEGLKHHDCGWWIEPTIDALTGALQEATGMEQNNLRVMGERGRDYALCFEWKNITSQTLSVYRWMLGQGSMPDCMSVY